MYSIEKIAYTVLQPQFTGLQKHIFIVIWATKLSNPPAMCQNLLKLYMKH